ncbi:hypothetical protein AY601_4423 [Pedobacter cryoconitis]|uniref:Uncharacterized protein n=1 Tax=Pedobacter cryoconitis TaxID=188932 RepID=A0A127VIW0_9SPHI|nr:hypothetical protein [Pedobacter cryoconitis]AMQ01264.1 hypothetical protein AY601_4423 [Pedobacter cryoconitis]
MKKQKIEKQLIFDKQIIGDLSAIKGGSAPVTMDVSTYQCQTAGAKCGTADPLPNPNTCSCGTPGDYNDTLRSCGTLPGIRVC